MKRDKETMTALAMGTLFIIAAPSGAGKTTLVKALINNLSDLMVSVSHTTRTKRTNEMHGVNYYFVNHEAFQQLIQQGDFLEYATIFDHLYGTSKRWVEETLKTGTDVILEIDWQGHQQIKRLFSSTVSIFVLPPSLEDLRERLTSRDLDHPDVIAKRLADAEETLSHVREFDYIVLNDHFEQALRDLIVIIKAERLRKDRQLVKHATLLATLLPTVS
jgi:guanylate kinase